MTVELTPVRLIVATDWDAGFQLTPAALPLDDVPPGGEYVTECAPQQSVVIHEVVVHNFRLVQISVGARTAETKLVSAGKDFKYRLKLPLQVLVGESVRLRLRNDAHVPKKPKTAVLVADRGDKYAPSATCPTCGSIDPKLHPQTLECRDAWHQVVEPNNQETLHAKLGSLKESTQRSMFQVCAPQSSAELVILLDALVAWKKPPEARDEITHYACRFLAANGQRISIEDTGGEPPEKIADAMIARAAAALVLGRSMDQQAPETPPGAVQDRPTRVTRPASAAADWIIEDVKIGNVVAAPDPSINPGGAMNSEGPVIPKTCPSCRSSNPEMRFGQRLAILVDGEPPPTVWCQDAWHDQPRPEPERHAPRIARTLMEGPGNHTLVRGCTCGAEVMSAEAYADHISWPVEAVRALLDLAGIADDLHRFPADGDWKLLGKTREDIWKQVSRCLEVRRLASPADYATSGPYKIRGGEVAGPNLRVIFDHVIKLLHIRHEVDPRGLPAASTMGAISELVALLNGAYDQGRRSPAQEDRR